MERSVKECSGGRCGGSAYELLLMAPWSDSKNTEGSQPHDLTARPTA